MTGARDHISPIRIDRSRAEPGTGFLDGETAYLRFTLDYQGIPFLDDLGGGWVSGEGPGWILHYRVDPGADAKTKFFPGLEITDEDGALELALRFLDRADADGDG